MHHLTNRLSKFLVSYLNIYLKHLLKMYRFRNLVHQQILNNHREHILLLLIKPTSFMRITACYIDSQLLCNMYHSCNIIALPTDILLFITFIIRAKLLLLKLKYCIDLIFFTANKILQVLCKKISRE